MERKEVTLYAMTVDDSRSVPILGIDNGNGTYSLSVVGADGNAIVIGAEKISPTDRSGTLGADSVAQQVMPTNLNRKYLFIQNVSSVDLWINFNTDANEDQPSIKILTNGAYFLEGSVIITDSVSIIGATTGSAYTAKEA